MCTSGCVLSLSINNLSLLLLCINSAFIFIAELYSIRQMIYDLAIILQLMDFCFFLICVLRNKAAMNIYVQVLVCL